MKICIDPGHGGIDDGAQGDAPCALKEKDFNLALSLLLEKQFTQQGHDVIMTRRTDRALRLGARAAFANRYQADFFISIHANGASNATAEGMEIFHYPGSQKAQIAAGQILTAMLDSFPNHKKRGVKDANFAVLRLTLMPAILIECEFVTTPVQCRFLADPNNQQELAKAIAEGVSAVSL